MAIDEVHLARQRAWSEATFGPGLRTKGLTAHIRSELIEIEDAPTDLFEWVDVVILALDGAWRAGYSASEILAAIEAKQTKNEARIWPDWHDSDEDTPIMHMESPQQESQRTCNSSAIAAENEWVWCVFPFLHRGLYCTDENGHWWMQGRHPYVFTKDPNMESPQG